MRKRGRWVSRGGLPRGTQGQRRNDSGETLRDRLVLCCGTQAIPLVTMPTGKFRLKNAAFSCNFGAFSQLRRYGCEDEARRWGLSPATAIFGKWHDASPEAMRALIDALSHGCDKPLQPQDKLNRWGISRGWAALGLAVQLYSRVTTRGGIGDFTDLKRLMNRSGHGAAAIALNPLHALFTDRLQDASPYAPNSGCF